jgi:hypothetical protein
VIVSFSERKSVHLDLSESDEYVGTYLKIYIICAKPQINSKALAVVGVDSDQLPTKFVSHVPIKIFSSLLPVRPVLDTLS